MINWLKQKLPSHDAIRHHKMLKIFGNFIHSPNLWHMNRGSMSRGAAIGLFWAFIPMPFQMVPAAACAIVLRANVFLSAALVWVSNPITIPPMIYFCYRVGRFILGLPKRPFQFAMSWHWLQTTFLQIWKPLLVGCLTCGILSAVVGYAVMYFIYRKQ